MLVDVNSLWYPIDIPHSVDLLERRTNNTCPSPWSADNYFDVSVCRVSLFDVFWRFCTINTSHVRSCKQKRHLHSVNADSLLTSWATVSFRKALSSFGLSLGVHCISCEWICAGTDDRKVTGSWNRRNLALCRVPSTCRCQMQLYASFELCPLERLRGLICCIFRTLIRRVKCTDRATNALWFMAVVLVRSGHQVSAPHVAFFRVVRQGIQI